jgi:hypothetical protein
MTRSNLIRIPLNEKQTRYKLVYRSEPCEPNSVAGRNTQVDILGTLRDQPQLLYCGPVLFDTMKISHDGTCWVVEMEAVESFT